MIRLFHYKEVLSNESWIKKASIEKKVNSKSSSIKREFCKKYVGSKSIILIRL